MDALLMQPWLTLSADSAATFIYQDVAAYLDLPGAIDLTFFLQVKSVIVTSGTVRITYQTSPSLDESAFRPMLAPVVLDMVPLLTTTRATLSSATTPVARYLRWQLTSTGTGTWGATFRVYASYSVSATDALRDGLELETAGSRRAAARAGGPLSLVEVEREVGQIQMRGTKRGS